MFQMIRMNNERFAVPELLFHPSDVGIQEMGIPEAIIYVLSKLDEGNYLHFYLFLSLYAVSFYSLDVAFQEIFIFETIVYVI